jgi:pimeloyl-ACP methyl ester carboxylesterase
VPIQRGATRSACTAQQPCGTVVLCTLAHDPAQQYFLYMPHSASNHAPLFVTVHGVSRNAKEHARRFAPFAERYGVVLVAPLFPPERFPDYQQLGRNGHSLRADAVLDAIVAEVGALTGANTDKLFLFGYSGGGQFVHRYTLAHPERVAKVAVGAAGWYTFPDPAARYPRGLKLTKNFSDLHFDPKQFLTIPAAVFVGERDVHRGSELRKTEKTDDQQGATRLERARHWVEAMTTAARAAQLDTPYDFEILPRSGHSFRRSMKRGDMGTRVFDFLFGHRPEVPSISHNTEHCLMGDVL